MNSYVIGNSILLTSTFAVSQTNAPVDPATVNLKTLDPAGTIVTLTGVQLIKNSVGNYQYVLTPTQIGVWVYRWEGVGTASSAAENSFMINQTRI
jgi:hypothetical protein